MIRDYIAFDLETTGLSVENNEIIEIGALKVKDGKVTERFMEFLKPCEPISPMITDITGITNEMVADARNTQAVISDFVLFCEELPLVGHNIMFDYKFTNKYATAYGLTFEKNGIDTLKIARKIHKDFESRSLGVLCEYYHIINQAAHRAYHDALATAKLYQCMAHYYEETDPKLFEPTKLECKVKKVQPMTPRQKEFLKALCQYHNLSENHNLETLTRSEASKLIDSIISTYGNFPYVSTQKP